MAHLEQHPAAGHAVPAPQAEVMNEFVLRMASHGHSVSGTLMKFDRQYALEQLSHAHTMADEGLRALAMRLFRQFEGRRSPLPHLA